MPRPYSLRNNPQFRLLNAWADLDAENIKLKSRIADLEEEITRLNKELEEARRASKRQAAPFAKGGPKAHPKHPGRKPGHVAAQRPPPQPTEIHAVEDAPLPAACPACGGRFTEERIAVQFQVDIPPITPITTQFNVHVGHCERCGRHVQGHHPGQTSDALGAANLALGPRALALAAEAKHDLGVPYTKIARFFQVAFGLTVCRATFARSDQRVAKAYLGVYVQMIFALRQADAIGVDETGWRVGGYSAWLWVFATDSLTLYVIDPSRGHPVPENVLGSDFDGFVVADGLKSYNALDYRQQKCLRHLIRNAEEILEAKTGPAAAFSRQAAALFRGAIHLHHRRQAGQISDHGYAIACARLEHAFDRLLARHLSDPDNRHFADRLRAHRHQLFAFLYHPGLPPTNARAEQEIRPAVVVRKTSACNRAYTGAHVHEVLASVIRTCRRHGQSFIDLTFHRLTHPEAPLPDWFARLLLLTPQPSPPIAVAPP